MGGSGKHRDLRAHRSRICHLRALHGSAYTPPNLTGIFADLAVVGNERMEPWVDEFYSEGLTMGCGTGALIYCPENRTTRAEMAVFVDRAVRLYP